MKWDKQIYKYFPLLSDGVCIQLEAQLVLEKFVTTSTCTILALQKTNLTLCKN